MKEALLLSYLVLQSNVYIKYICHVWSSINTLLLSDSINTVVTSGLKEEELCSNK